MKNNTIIRIPDPKAAIAFLDEWERLLNEKINKHPSPIYTLSEIEMAKKDLESLTGYGVGIALRRSNLMKIIKSTPKEEQLSEEQYQHQVLMFRNY